ncbi:class I lanthipeptide [Flavobacterium sp. FlaQc-52]|jgi:bacteriocin-like protein|uniref:Class I lanthipeptide n=1 Tax=Flavobacterium cupriresistens TaxID=2893885 RepID=A0ABU4RHU6_9FLAO|nr:MULTISPECIES: class I lanthipeptide [unclassified Flavobacterium]MDX6192125.1 class I lanthipeptide [Flavobacterium sp. Fl-318]UFH43740.1 class I lanthipeptide [Flavobacterium sp. F-323]
MKKQNPTNKLAFNKVAVAELNEKQLTAINGGTSVFTVGGTSLIFITLMQN